MSRHEEVEIACPACGVHSSCAEYSTIEPHVEPALKERLLSGELHRFRCASCGHEVRLDYPVLYDDRTRGLMIQHDPSGELSPDECPPPDELEPSPRVTRLVYRHNDLLEKILLHDAGLDDRAFEVLKLIVNTEEEGAARAACFFEDVQGDELALTLIDEEGVSGALVPRSLYERIVTDLTSRGLLAEQPPWGVVDHSFALELLEQPRED